MAELIPSLSTCVGKMQAGEKRFATRLSTHLEDDYSCWYEMPVGFRARYTDFIILHPNRGLLLLEVKDWKIETLRDLNPVSATILTNTGLKTVSNPLEQVRQCTYALINKLKNDPALIHPGGKYKGGLIFPYGFGVVLSNITRKQFNDNQLEQVIPNHKVICKDEMTESIDPETFQKHLWDMFDISFPYTLSLPQIDRIRWHLFPEIRIPENQNSDLFENSDSNFKEAIPGIIKVLDKEQEKLAKNLGTGHRVIHGVAGSGKTLILGYRCLHLAQALNKPILVLCYNVTLAARLRELISKNGLEHKVQIQHFHDWCSDQLRLYNIQKPEFGTKYPERLVARVIDSVAKGSIPAGQYGAVMVDEGHDFEADWLKLVVGMVDPESDSFLLLYDDAQSIYSQNKDLDFSLSNVGIKARGRTKILKLNYRNTQEIVNFAYQFASNYLQPKEITEKTTPLVTPECGGNNGSKPVLRKFSTFNKEAHYIANLLCNMHKEQQTPWKDMCVLYRSFWMGEEVEKVLKSRNIPVDYMESKNDKINYRNTNNTVKLMTMHSSKGLEFPVVAIAGLGYLPLPKSEKSVEAKLLYVAMTRATEKLLITCHQPSEFYSILDKQEHRYADHSSTHSTNNLTPA